MLSSSETESRMLTKRQKPLSGVEVFVVEDEVLQAIQLMDIVRELGGSVAASAYAFEQALEAVDHIECDCAILDLNLKGTLSFRIAAKLQQKGIPVLFCSAYAEAANVFPGLRQVPCLDKPVNTVKVRDALLGILRGAQHEQRSDRNRQH